MWQMKMVNFFIKQKEVEHLENKFDPELYQYGVFTGCI